MNTDVCHIREISTLPDIRGLCGERAVESISMFHFSTHVLETKDECCAALYRRLCPECMEIFNRTLAETVQAPR